MKNNKNLVIILTSIVLVVFISLSFLIYDKSDAVIIKGTTGSYAEVFANANGLKFVAIADSDNPNVDIPVVEEPTETPTEAPTEEPTEKAPVIKENSTFAYNYVNEKTVTIVGYKGTSRFVIIPDTIDALPVTAVTFSPIDEGIDMIQFSDNVTSIEGKYVAARYTAEFFAAIVIMLLGYAYAIFATFMAFGKADTKEKTFYGVPIVYNGFSTFVVITITSALFLILNLPIVAMAIVTIVILAISAVGLVKKNAAREAVEATGEKVKQQTAFIKLLTADAEHIMSTAKSSEIKADAKKVYEAIRYSDPMSNDALADIETRIQYQFNAFAAAVKNENAELSASISTEILDLIDARNKKCKVLK